MVVAKLQSHSVTCARSIRHWVLCFLQTDELPHLNYSSTHSLVLEDEELCHEIQAALGEKSKHGSIMATNLVDVIASPKIQKQFKNAGIDKPFISECTAHRWLRTLGWQYGKIKNSMYIDGHERKDIVQYRTTFVDRFQQYERQFHLWDDNGEALPCPNGFSVPEAAGWFQIILITHDESTFFQNDQCNVGWDHVGSSKAPKPKGDGQSLMVSDFLTMDWGHLCDGDKCVPLTPLLSFDLILHIPAKHTFFSNQESQEMVGSQPATCLHRWTIQLISLRASQKEWSRACSSSTTPQVIKSVQMMRSQHSEWLKVCSVFIEVLICFSFFLQH